MNWSDALALAEKGFDAWAAKPHNRKWFRKIDGTPIKNDLLVNIATAFAEALIAAPANPAPIAELEPVAWQPIKTAPRDGTPILCFTPDYQSEFSDQSGIDVLWFDGAWLYNAEPVTFQPTHWMPLPASPNSASSALRQLEARAAEQVRAERKVCAKIADDWRVSEINNGDLTNEQLNQLLNGIGPNIAAAIRARGQV